MMTPRESLATMLLHRRARGLRVTIAATAMALACAASPPAATAQPDNGSLNGRYIATSNGEWAQTNDQFRGETSVRSTWTISSTCVDPTDCTGTLSSDLGWTADIYKKSGMWYVRHTIPSWRQCSDGTSADGLQLFRFYAGDPLTGQAVPSGSDTYLGDEVTSSASGACGINKQLVIKMPFKMVAVAV
ncbi:MAG: hypothetical protein JWR11_48 [Mycobacterium sp.]|nr:hypothetical protein [Mycobacterium sp.]